MDEGEDEHDAEDGDEGVRRLCWQKRVGVGQVDGGALKLQVKTKYQKIPREKLTSG